MNEETNKAIFPVVEIFESIQGEGLYTGVPSVFVRVTGCNLRCCFKNSICDSAYTSHKAEAPKWIHVKDVIKEIMRIKSPKTDHIVITGGEPMLYQKGLNVLTYELGKLTFYEDTPDFKITIETNGTIVPNQDSLNDIMLWSLSPKLESSCCFEGKHLFKSEQEQHERLRFNPEALSDYIIDGRRVQLKFVWCGEETEKEIDKFLEDLSKYVETDIVPKTAIHTQEIFQHNMDSGMVQILLMPAGQTQEQISSNAKSAVDACIRRGWRYCDRTHIRIWGDLRGV